MGDAPFAFAESEAIDITEAVDEVVDTTVFLQPNVVGLRVGLDMGFLGVLEPDADLAREMLGIREIGPDAGFERLEVPVFDRLSLSPGIRIPGPAIFEQLDTTTLLSPGWVASVAPDRTLILTPA